MKLLCCFYYTCVQINNNNTVKKKLRRVLVEKRISRVVEYLLEQFFHTNLGSRLRYVGHGRIVDRFVTGNVCDRFFFFFWDKILSLFIIVKYRNIVARAVVVIFSVLEGLLCVFFLFLCGCCLFLLCDLMLKHTEIQWYMLLYFLCQKDL